MLRITQFPDKEPRLLECNAFSVCSNVRLLLLSDCCSSESDVTATSGAPAAPDSSEDSSAILGLSSIAFVGLVIGAGKSRNWNDGYVT